jgi:hypothetical protein
LQRFPDAATMQMAWRDVAMAMDRRTKSPDRWWSRFSVLSQGERG